MKVFLFASFFVTHTFAAELLVKKLVWSDEKKMYEVYFDKSAGVHLADEKHYECLSFSLSKERPAKIEVEDKKLILKSCAMVESK